MTDEAFKIFRFELSSSLSQGRSKNFRAQMPIIDISPFIFNIMYVCLSISSWFPHLSLNTIDDLGIIIKLNWKILIKFKRNIQIC